MTPQQSKALIFIDMFWDEHAYSPTYKDIMEHLGLASKSGIYRIVSALVRDGYITHEHNRRRNLRVIDMPEALKKKKERLKNE